MIGKSMTQRDAWLLLRFSVLLQTAHTVLVAPEDLATGSRVLERWRREGAGAPVTEAERAAIAPAVAVMEAALHRRSTEQKAAA